MPIDQLTLHLTLKREPFDVMITEEKNEEFRKPTKWIKSRLYNKDGTPKIYDHVKFVNGYGCDRPQFIVDYKGFEIIKENQTIKYSNGLVVKVEKGDIKIKLGSVFYRLNNLKDENN